LEVNNLFTITIVHFGLAGFVNLTKNKNEIKSAVGLTGIQDYPDCRDTKNKSTINQGKTGGRCTQAGTCS